MPGPAPKPQAERHSRKKPARGEFKTASVVGWRHGEVPEPPDGMMASSVETWKLWFGSWWAAHWSKADVPVLRMTIRLFDEIERGITKKAQDRAQLHTWLRAYGITPDGQLANRWAPPKHEEVPSSSPQPHRRAELAEKYAGLRVLGDEEELPA